MNSLSVDACISTATVSLKGFPISLDNIWRDLGYKQKSGALNALKGRFQEGVDFVAEERTVPLRGRPTPEYKLTVDCFNAFKSAAEESVSVTENIPSVLFYGNGFVSFGNNGTPLELHVRYGHHFIEKEDVSTKSPKYCKHGHRSNDGVNSLRRVKSSYDCIVCKWISFQNRIDSGAHAKMRAAQYAKNRDKHNQDCLDRYYRNREQIREKQNARRAVKRERVHSGDVGQHYYGKPCKNCGGTLRYTSRNDCVACTKERAKRSFAKPESKKARNEGIARWRERKNQQKGIIYTQSDLNLLLSKFEHQCAYCGKDLQVVPPEEKGFDHVTPMSRGGLDEIVNMVPVCRSCNSSKQNKSFQSWYKHQPFFDENRQHKVQEHIKG